MAEYRYNVDHDVNYNEMDEIRGILSQLKGEDTCSIIIDGVDSRNADRVISLVDEDVFHYYTKGIGDNNDTQIIVTRKM